MLEVYGSDPERGRFTPRGGPSLRHPPPDEPPRRSVEGWTIALF